MSENSIVKKFWDSQHSSTQRCFLEAYNELYDRADQVLTKSNNHQNQKTLATKLGLIYNRLRELTLDMEQIVEDIYAGGKLELTREESQRLRAIEKSKQMLNDLLMLSSAMVTESTEADHSTVAGGYANKALDNHATICGGKGNSATKTYSTIGGGENKIASGDRSTIGGGKTNKADSRYSTAQHITL